MFSVSRHSGAALSRPVRFRLAAAAVLAALAAPAADIAIFQHEAGHVPAAALAKIENALRADGHTVEVLSEPGLEAIAPGKPDLLILADPAVFPGAALTALDSYLADGGKLMTLGTDAFSDPRWRLGDATYSPAEYLARIVDKSAPLALESLPTAVWAHASDDPRAGSRMSTGPDGALEFRLRDWKVYDTFLLAFPVSPFGAGYTVTQLKARCRTGLTAFVIEWKERDGSRWIATVPVGDEWRTVILPPSEFQYWRGGENRGFAGDQFNPAQAAVLSIGVANTHQEYLPAPEHILEIAGFSTVAVTEAAQNEIRKIDFQNRSAAIIEGVAPAYKNYPIGNRAGYAVDPTLGLSGIAAFPADWATYSPVPRSGGSGLHRRRPIRQIPVILALDDAGVPTGAPAAVILDRCDGDRPRIIMPILLDDPKDFDTPETATLIARLADRATKPFLLDGGSERYVLFGAETMPVGATVWNPDNTPFHGRLRITVSDPATGVAMYRRDEAIELTPKERREYSEAVAFPSAPGADYAVTVELCDQTEAAIDRIAHRLRGWSTPEQPQFVGIRNGRFELGGKRWFAHGINYMPSSGVGSEDAGLWEFYLGRRAYDQAIVERDLKDIKAIGLNAISVFVYDDGFDQSVSSRNLNDLLLTCRELGFKVNLAIRPGTPLGLPRDPIRRAITECRLAEDDTVFAYDMAWEPCWGFYAQRNWQDGEWRDWVLARYGSPEAAERTWNYPAPRVDGKLTVPGDELLWSEGAWTALVVDYRKFLNELLHARYRAGTDYYHELAPRQLASFRMFYTGSPGVRDLGLQFDAEGLAGAVDFMAPEGYARGGGWDNTRVGIFTDAYFRAFAPEAPVIWPEFGFNLLPKRHFFPVPETLAVQRGFYSDFYRMLLESDADGSFAWYFPGGYRVGENSDFGIVNPDRSWRPAAEVMHRWAGRLQAERPADRRETVELEFTPGSRAGGISSLYRELGDTFFQALDAGKKPVLKLKQP